MSSPGNLNPAAQVAPSDSEPDHIPVLLQETVDGMNVSSAANCIDGTLGGGGHTRALLKATAPNGVVIGFDRDADTLAATTTALAQEGINVEPGDEQRFIPIHGSYATLADQPAVMTRSINAITVDLGLSSMQLDDPDRGFAFRFDGPLDMRFDHNTGLTAADLLQSQSQDELKRIFRDYGEERNAGRLAAAVVKQREVEPIETTTQLRELVEKTLGYHAGMRIHPATRVFQALRIAVNDELGELERFLPSAVSCLSTAGRLAVITFHSLEDRMVKRFFKEEAKDCVCPPELPECRCEKTPTLRIITKKPIIPSEEEIERNPRARSAKLRIAEKI